MMWFVLGWAVILSLVAGCSTDVKNIEMLNYASAIGVDYKDGVYYGYVQFVDFQSVAKTEGPKEPAKVWVGEGIGPTFEESFFDIYRTAQERIYWGHVTSIVLSESVFKQGVQSVLDSISRYYEFRLTPWVFSTRESMKDIFSATGFLEQSPLSTILHEPEGIYAQTSQLKAIKLHRLIAQLYEPGYTTCVPTLALNKERWTEGRNKPEPKLMLDGAVFLKNDSYRSFIGLKQLNGLRWVQHGSLRNGISVPSSTDATAQIVVEKPKTNMQLLHDSSKPQFKLAMQATGFIVNRQNNKLPGLGQLTDATKEAIEREIRETFQTGLEKQTDVLNLEHNLYRNHYRAWKTLSTSKKDLLAENTIAEIDIDLNITHSSSEKNKRIEMPFR